MATKLRFFSAKFKSRILCGSFFVFCGLQASAKLETGNDIIDKAYSLISQKQRAQAVQILVGAIRRESKKSGKVPHDLQKALYTVATMFQTDRAQQLYELAQSLRMSDVNMSNAKLLEAMKDDPDNMLLQILQMQNQVVVNDCGSALSSAKKQKEALPFVEEVDLILASAAICSGQFESYLATSAGIDRKTSTLQPYWDLLEMEYLYKSGKFDKGILLAENLQKREPTLPESSYWRWKMSSEAATKGSKSDSTAEEAANRYLNLCKTLSPRQGRLFSAEPYLCRRTAEVEVYLKKNNNDVK